MTDRLSIARSILTLILGASAISAFVLDWSPNHLLNPLWHPHAKFHGALLLFFLAGVCGAGIWQMWRDPGESSLRMSGLIALSFWTPLFYIATLLPGASSWAGAFEKDPRIAGSWFTPNMPPAAGAVALTLVALWLTFRKRSQPC